MIDLLSRKLAIQASTNVTSVLSSNGAAVVGTTQGQSVQQALDQVTGASVITPPTRSLSDNVAVGPAQQASGGGAIISSTANTIASVTGAAGVLRDMTLSGAQVTAGATVVGVGVTDVTGTDLRHLSVDLTASNGTGLPAYNLTGNIVDHMSFGVRGNTTGYGYLTNEAAGSTNTMDGHVLIGFNIKARADAIEYNNPGAPLKHSVTWGGVLDAGRGGSGCTAGFALGLAHNQGWVAGGFVSRYSRREAVHVEDGSSFGVLSSFVLRGCQTHGVWAGVMGNNVAQATPIVISGFSAEGPGATAGAYNGVYMTWDSTGCCMNWPVASGYVKAFQNGLYIDGPGVKPATWVVADACTNVLQLATMADHRGTLFSNGATNLLTTTGNGANIADVFVQNDVAATKLIAPTGTRGIKDALRGFDMPALGSKAAIGAQSYYYMPLFQAPARMRGQLTVLMGTGRTGVMWHGSVNCEEGLTVASLITPVSESIGTVAMANCPIGGGTAVSAAGSSSIITVTAPSGTLGAGQVVASGLIAGTRIVRQLTGTTGGAGTYLIDIPQTVASGTTFTTSSPFRINAGNVECMLYNAGSALAAGAFPVRVEFSGLFYA